MLLRSFLRDKDIAAVASTSRWGVRSACQNIDLARARVVVEYGPGAGPFTRFLLSRMRPDAVLVAIEKNAQLARHLRQIDDPRLVVVEDVVENVHGVLREQGISCVDVVLSGIPLSFFGVERKRRLVVDTASVLRPGGMFVVYQYSFHARRFLRECFDVRSRVCFWNFPPLHIMEAVRRDGTETYICP